tara:strand:- start:873 stop:1214 length:342 start_codon:yes stop_codon:yes gene_type:complete
MEKETKTEASNARKDKHSANKWYRDQLARNRRRRNIMSPHTPEKQEDPRDRVYREFIKNQENGATLKRLMNTVTLIIIAGGVTFLAITYLVNHHNERKPKETPPANATRHLPT